MARTTESFTFKGELITFTNDIAPQNPNFIFTNKYHFVEIGGQRREMVAHSLKTEFYDDIKTQLKFLENVELSEKNFFESLIEGCAKHVERFRRIIITDLNGYLDVCLHIMDATQPKYHSLISTEEKAIVLRNKFLKGAIHVFQDHLYVPHPFLKESNGMSKIIPFKEAKNLL